MPSAKFPDKAVHSQLLLPFNRFYLKTYYTCFDSNSSLSHEAKEKNAKSLLRRAQKTFKSSPQACLFVFFSLPFSGMKADYQLGDAFVSK